jgi:hypothetical protein
MGVARLFAKGWIVFCVFAAAHGLRLAIVRGEAPADAISEVVLPVLLFLAVGLVFVLGYATSGNLRALPAALEGIKPSRFLPGFNDLVFVGFLATSFMNQVFIAPTEMDSPVARAISAAVAAIVPGQAAFQDQLGDCSLDGGRIFSSAFAWILALVFVASAVSRIRLTAGVIRMEWAARPEPLGGLTLAIVLGLLSIAGIQLLLVGDMYPWLPCGAFMDISGALLIGLAPLMLAYLVVAAIATALATGRA